MSDLTGARRVALTAPAVHPDDPVNDFGVCYLGFQIRYRYELALLSELHGPHARGDYLLDPRYEEADSQFGRSFDLRGSEPSLVRLSYRLEP